MAGRVAGLYHIRVLCSSPAQLSSVTASHQLVTRVQQTRPSSRVIVSVKPSVLSQLSVDTVSAWSRVCSHLYTRVTARDVCLVFGDGDNVPVDEELSVSGDNDASDHGTPAPGQLYKHVVLGGTFDRLHNGHKILLSAALLRCDTRITVGVTAPSLLNKKMLPELIQSVQDRIDSVESFIEQVRPGLEKKVVMITDPFGPAIVLPELQCIVASQETERGCVAINEKRREAGLNSLDIHLIDLAQDDNRQSSVEEEKISSSSGRMRLLGTRLRPAMRSWERGEGPYMIGLTGGSASGKSSVGRRLETMGWGVVDCDKLGHMAYTPGQPAHTQLVQEFGQQILAADGTIDRRALGGIVFSDKAKLTILNNIVWPEIARLAMEQAQSLWREGKQVVVLDAAVLLEAGWEAQCHEVWVCVVPREEAVKRIVDRDKKTEEEAGRRLDSQMSNQERVERAATVISTLWSPDITLSQVTRAVQRLNNELGL